MKMMYNRRRRAWLIGVLFFAWMGLFAFCEVHPDFSVDSILSSPAETREVHIKNHLFNPATITIKVNEKIRWTNNDFAPHSVTANDGSFNSGMIFPGRSWTYQFIKPGTYNYFCKYHKYMLGTVIVEAVTAEK